MKGASLQLRGLASLHLRKRKEAHRTETLQLKDHYQFDLADQLDRDSDVRIITDEFVSERLHLRVK